MISRLCSIDSGALECALAWWRDERLESVESLVDGVGFPGFTQDMGYTVVVEIPQDDGRAVPSDDLIRVAVNGARLAERIAGRSGTVVELRPREWKGSVPKAICHGRMWAALSYAERLLLGGRDTELATEQACKRGALARWKPHHSHYYRARELPTVGNLKITHDRLDAVAIGLYYLGRLQGPVSAPTPVRTQRIRKKKASTV